MAVDFYMRLDYRAYKALEDAMREFKETTHKGTEGHYHKSIRIPLGEGVEMEFHGPLVFSDEALYNVRAAN